MLEGGHAYNALPQIARATVNCRIMPGEPVDEVKATLVRVLADDQIDVTQIGEPPRNFSVTQPTATGR